MADQNIKDFTVNWILFGVLFFSLMFFSLSFVFNNNSDALGEYKANYDIYSANISSNLLELEGDSNEQINISAIIESEDLELGSRVAASNSYGFMSSARNYWSGTKEFTALMFEGTAGQIITGVFSGLFLIIALFFIFRLGRTIF